jgi:hypothetical protein
VNSKFYTTNSFESLGVKTHLSQCELIKYQSLVEQMKAHGRIAISEITLDMSQKILERAMCFLCLIPCLLVPKRKSSKDCCFFHLERQQFFMDERIGLIPRMNRNKSGIRDFTEEDCGWYEQWC